MLCSCCTLAPCAPIQADILTTALAIKHTHAHKKTEYIWAAHQRPGNCVWILNAFRCPPAVMARPSVSYSAPWWCSLIDMQGEACTEQWASFQASSRPAGAPSPAFCALCSRCACISTKKRQITLQNTYCIYMQRRVLQCKKVHNAICNAERWWPHLHYKNRSKIGPVRVTNTF